MPNISIKVLTYNIHKGFNTSNLRFILHEIKNALRKVDADIIFLQEIQGDRQISKKRFDNWHNNNQLDFLADKIWPHHAYGKNAIYKAGHHGNAILSKYPFIEWENIDVSILRSASRSLLYGVIKLPDSEKRIHIVCVHLGLFERERERQIITLSQRINLVVPPDEALIIAGDFNDWRSRAEQYLYRELNISEVFKDSYGAYARTFPSWLPMLSMDRIYYRGLDIVASKPLYGKPWSRLSDHAPLSAEFKIL
jgi:endonuclease/exonuclease/phosphatase family metal-dependent hydrolase